MQTECSTGNLPRSVSEYAFSVVFRAVQVGFINALHHGQAKRIRLLFWVDDDLLSMSLWNDNRAGAEPTRIHEGIGLRGLRERLELLGGELRLGRVVDGFKLVVMIPIAEADEFDDSSSNS